MLTVRSRVAGAFGALAVSVLLAACGSDPVDKPDADASPRPSSSASPSASASATDYLPVPDGVTLTPPGTSLPLGQAGVVAFERRQKEVAAVSVTVQRIEQTSFARSFPGWTLDAATAALTPFFVRVQVTNVGSTDLGGVVLDNLLYADDGATLQAPNYYTAEQQPACVGGALPTPFAQGASAELCQVYYVAPGSRLQAVSFQPFGGGEPITWSGAYSKVTKPGKRPKDAPSVSGSPSPSPSPSGSAAPSSPSPSASASRSASSTPAASPGPPASR